MRSHTVSTAVTLCAAASLVAAVGSASAAPATAHPVANAAQTPGRPVLVDCLWHPQVHPGDFMIACGDGNSRLVSLTWSHWGPNSAEAKGVNMVNDCKPYCAAGKFHAYPVIVRLAHPMPWKKHPQMEQYTQMNLVYTHGSPEGFGQAVSYPLWS